VVNTVCGVAARIGYETGIGSFWALYELVPSHREPYWLHCNGVVSYSRVYDSTSSSTSTLASGGISVFAGCSTSVYVRRELTLSKPIVRLSRLTCLLRAFPAKCGLYTLPPQSVTGYSEHKIHSSRFILVSQNWSVSCNRKWQLVQRRWDGNRAPYRWPAWFPISLIGPIRYLKLFPIGSYPAPHERRSDWSGSQQRPTCNRLDRSKSFLMSVDSVSGGGPGSSRPITDSGQNNLVFSSCKAH
jgi:hypothetical protein